MRRGMTRRLLIVAALILMPVLVWAPARVGVSAGAAGRPAAPRCIIHVGIPLNALIFSPSDLLKDFTPLVRMGEERTGCRAEVRFYKSEEEIIEGLRRGTVDMTSGDAAFYVDALREAIAEPLVRIVINGNANHRAVLYVRKDSGIRSAQDLRGRAFAYADEHSYSGFLFVDAELKKTSPGGLRATAGRLLKCQTHQAALYAVVLRQADAAASNEDFLRVEPLAKRLRPVLYSPSYPYTPLIVRKGLAPKLKRRMAEAFIAMSRTELWVNASKTLGVVTVEPARDEDFDVFRKTLTEIGYLPLEGNPSR